MLRAPDEADLDLGEDMSDPIRGVTFVRGVDYPDIIDGHDFEEDDVGDDDQQVLANAGLCGGGLCATDHGSDEGAACANGDNGGGILEVGAAPLLRESAVDRRHEEQERAEDTEDILNKDALPFSSGSGDIASIDDEGVASLPPGEPEEPGSGSLEDAEAGSRDRPHLYSSENDSLEIIAGSAGRALRNLRRGRTSPNS